MLSAAQSPDASLTSGKNVCLPHLRPPAAPGLERRPQQHIESELLNLALQLEDRWRPTTGRTQEHTGGRET